MKEIKTIRPRRTIEPLKTYERLTALVVAHSDSMQQKHPSGMTKMEMAEKAMITLFEGMAQSSKRLCESFARVESGTGLTANAMETAYYITLAWRKRQEEGYFPYVSQIILLTDGNDEQKEETKRIVDALDENSIPLFIYHLPSEDNPKEGYDYCVSLGHTHSMYDIKSLLQVLYMDDLDSCLLRELFTGF